MALRIVWLASLLVTACYVQAPPPYGPSNGQYAQQGQAQDQGQAPGQGQPADPYGAAPVAVAEPTAGSTLYQADAHEVSINGVALSHDQLLKFAQNGLPLPSGAYWYDRMSGAFGQLGGPTALFIWPNLPLAGTLSEGASNGRSHLVINGRRLTEAEADYLAEAAGQPIMGGRYFLDSQGNAGFEGGPVLINLLDVAREQGVDPEAGRAKFNSGWGGTYSSDGKCYYVSTSSGSVMGPGC